MQNIKKHKIIVIAFALWAFLLVAQYFYIKDYRSLINFRGSTELIFIQSIGFIVFFITMILSYPFIVMNPIRGSDRNVLLMLWLSFIVWVIVTSPLSLSPVQSGLYAFVMLAMISSFIAFGSQPYDVIKKSYFAASVFALIALTIILITNGYNGRTIGWTPPNNIGKVGFCIVVLALSSGHRYGKWIAALGFAYILLVNSRGMILSSIAFTSLFYIVSGGTRALSRRVMSLTGIIIALVGFASILSLSDSLRGNDIRLLEVSKSVTAIDDENRGLSSGFTGRTDHWRIGISLFSEEPIFGHGFRTRESIAASDIMTRSAHSGWINLAVDTGFIGFIIVVSIYITAAFRGLKIKHMSACVLSQEDKNLISASTFSYFTVSSLFWFFEPTYFNFGMIDIIVFFAMMGVVIRRGYSPAFRSIFSNKVRINAYRA